MYYYGQQYGCPGTQQYGYAYPQTTGGYGGMFAIILVIFILLVIIGCSCGHWEKPHCGHGCCGGI